MSVVATTCCDSVYTGLVTGFGPSSMDHRGIQRLQSPRRKWVCGFAIASLEFDQTLSTWNSKWPTNGGVVVWR